ncbi:hypothetical protein HDK64DRAFT_310113 [Phyllosticta capitalensis]
MANTQDDKSVIFAGFGAGEAFSLTVEDHYRAVAKSFVEASVPAALRPLVFPSFTSADQYFRWLLKANSFRMPDFRGTCSQTAFKVIFNGLLAQLFTTGIFQIEAAMDIRPDPKRRSIATAPIPATDAAGQPDGQPVPLALNDGQRQEQSDVERQLRDEMFRKDQRIQVLERLLKQKNSALELAEAKLAAVERGEPAIIDLTNEDEEPAPATQPRASAQNLGRFNPRARRATPADNQQTQRTGTSSGPAANTRTKKRKQDDVFKTEPEG